MIVQRYVKRPGELHQQRKSPQLLCPCSMEEATCKYIFSVIFIENILARCKIFFCLIFLFCITFHGLVWSKNGVVLLMCWELGKLQSLPELRIAVHRLWLRRLRSRMRTATLSPQLSWLSESTGVF